MLKRRFYTLLTLVALAMMLVAGMGQTQAASPQLAAASTGSAPASQPAAKVSTEAKITPALRTQMQQVQSNKQSIGYMVMLKEQANTANNISPLQWKEKGEYVYNKLIETAQHTQPAVSRTLDALRGMGQVKSYQAFWIVNSFYVQGTTTSIDSLAANDAISLLDIVHFYKPSDDRAVNAAPLSQPAPSNPEVVQPGVSRINAPAVWAQGYIGQGITVGSLDTGAVYTHEALIRQWRGTLMGTSDFNWKDSLDGNNAYPYDESAQSFHGTHTLGTTVGENATQTQQIGVAPGANWISCRIFGSNPNSGASFVILPCGQWMLAPTDHNGNNPRPELRPQVVGNSWGSSNGNDQFFSASIDAWINAGIFPNFSNGNDGPGSGTVGSPASYSKAFGVGATGTTNDTIASFSSRGPSPIDGGLKPQVTAPGVNVLSSVGPTSMSYGLLSGTSMAQPHVAGSIAVLLSKNRGLTVQQLKDVLTTTAYFTTAMGTRPNNNYGWGRVDLLAAANSVTAANGYITGRITDSGSNGIAGASVTVSGGSTLAAATNAQGYYTMTVVAGSYTVTAAKYGYVSNSGGPVNVTVGMTATQNLVLQTATTATIGGTLNGPSGPISGTVAIVSSPITPVQATGSYSFSGVAAGSYQVVFTPDDNCLGPVSQNVTVPPNATVNLTATYKHDTFGYVCSNTDALNYIAGTTQVTNFVPNADDGVATIAYPSGFAFQYYGQALSGNIGVGSNGYIEFNGTDVSNGGSQIPNLAPPNNAIYAMLDDLVVDGNPGNVYTALTGTAPNRKFVVEWRNAVHYGTPNYGNYNFEIVLEETTNKVYIEYQSMTGPGADGATASAVGIENQTGSDGINYAYLDAGAIHSNLVVKFTPPLGGGTPTPTNTPGGATNTPTMTPAPPTNTPTATPMPGDQWQPYTPDLPESRLRGTAQVLSNTLYYIGGRMNSTYRDNIFYRNISSGNWMTSTATFTTVNMSNVQSAVLTDALGSHIFVLGGTGPSSDFTLAGMLYEFTPGTPDTILTIDTDRWPARTPEGLGEIGGGSFVYNNKWYVYGGYGLDSGGNNVMDNRTWVFNPLAAPGSRWTQLTSANLSMARGYIGSTIVDGKGYAIGGSQDAGAGSLTDEMIVERIDPSVVSPTWSIRASMPMSNSNLQAYGFSTGTGTDIDGKVVIAGGRINNPSPINNGYIYDPASDTWSTFANFITARRNYAKAQYGHAFYALGGIVTNPSTGTATNEMLMAANAPTPTVTPTPTDCPNPFVDITGNTFYFAIHYLYCRGVVNGTDGTHFSPHNTATRAQFAKVVVLGFGIAPYTPTVQDFTDVPPAYFAYAFIEAGFHAGILNGFDPATCTANGAVYPCYLPNLAITRGQVTKLVVSAAHYALVTPVGGGQTYSDVPPSNVFYLYIETAHFKNVVNGFPDGTFRPNNNIQRDQMCQIVYKGVTTP